MNEHNSEQKQETGACGPGCSCGTTGDGTRKKWLICGIVALAAVVVVAARVSRTQGANGQAKTEEYALNASVVATADAAKLAPATDSDAWASPLKALAELNQVAADTDGVFVVLPSSDDAERMTAIRKEVSAAAATITARGTRMAKFVLSQNSQEYDELAQQFGTPAVLALCKGLGMAVVKDSEVTQDGLVKAFVASSRPSGCGPSGCGPGASDCN